MFPGLGTKPTLGQPCRIGGELWLFFQGRSKAHRSSATDGKPGCRWPERRLDLECKPSTPLHSPPPQISARGLLVDLFIQSSRETFNGFRSAIETIRIKGRKTKPVPLWASFMFLPCCCLFTAHASSLLEAIPVVMHWNTHTHTHTRPGCPLLLCEAADC